MDQLTRLIGLGQLLEVGCEFVEFLLSLFSVGQSLLLEVWNTLNVQCEVYVLDSFTFDDFVDAMRYSSLEPACELLEEVHCAVLKLFIDDDGALKPEYLDIIISDVS